MLIISFVIILETVITQVATITTRISNNIIETRVITRNNASAKLSEAHDILRTDRIGEIENG